MERDRDMERERDRAREMESQRERESQRGQREPASQRVELFFIFICNRVNTGIITIFSHYSSHAAGAVTKGGDDLYTRGGEALSSCPAAPLGKTLGDVDLKA